MHPMWARTRSASYRRGVFPATDWFFKRDTFRALAQIRQLEQMSAEELSAYQLDRLRALVAYASAHVPHYRDALRTAGVVTDGIKSLTDVSRVPVLTKAQLRTEADRLRSDEARGELKQFSTSGSTGTPLVVLEDQETNAWRRALKWRYLEWWGIQVGEPGGLVWLAPLSSVKGRLLKRLGFLLNNCNTFLNVGDLTEARMARFWRQARSRHLSYIYGYTSALVRLAQFAIDSGLGRREPLGLKVVVATTETLFAQQRQTMEEGFGTKVANEYGCAELGDIAFECPSGRLHIAAHSFLVDICRSIETTARRPTGEVAVTHLHKKSVPLIRYALGDIATLSDERCPCGRTLPVIDAVEGRVSDLITTPTGVVMHSEVFDYMMREFGGRENPAVVGFRVLQHGLTDFEVLLVPGGAFTPSVELEVVRVLQRTLGDDVSIRIRLTESIPADPNGKIRFFLRTY